MNAKGLINISEEFKGRRYVLGALPFRTNFKYLEDYLAGTVALDTSKVTGVFDCAEFTGTVVFLLLKKLYGCNHNNKPNSLRLADFWTNFYKRDYDAGRFKKISIQDARNTAGAFLLRYTKGSKIGHIAISKGDGTTIEAHSSRLGVTNSVVNSRTWDCAFVLTELDCKCVGTTPVIQPKIVYRLRTPMMESPFVGELQAKLKDLRFYSFRITNKYGQITFDAVWNYQKDKGLVVDGMVGTETAEALGLVLR